MIWLNDLIVRFVWDIEHPLLCEKTAKVDHIGLNFGGQMGEDGEDSTNSSLSKVTSSVYKKYTFLFCSGFTSWFSQSVSLV